MDCSMLGFRVLQYAQSLLKFTSIESVMLSNHLILCCLLLLLPVKTLILITSGKSISGFPGSSVVKHPPANARDVGLIPGLGRFPGGGNGNPLQYSCLENPTDRGA